MPYQEDSHSPINQAVKVLEKRIAFRKLKSINAKSSQPAPMDYIQMVLKGVEEPLKMVSEKLNEEAKKNPWSLLGKVAIGSFILGYIVGQHGPFRKNGQNE